MAAYTYMLECADGSLYTGWTDDLAKRLGAHNRGAGAKYTRSRLPVRLVYYEEHPDPKSAQERERAIKKLSRAQKQELVRLFAREARTAT
jgi:putative endonuclease